MLHWVVANRRFESFRFVIPVVHAAIVAVQRLWQLGLALGCEANGWQRIAGYSPLDVNVDSPQEAFLTYLSNQSIISACVCNTD